MRASSHIGAGELAFALSWIPIALPACTGGSARTGEVCAYTSDCLDGLQCFNRLCAPACATHVQCGDGYRCARSGECALVLSALGDRCFREIECGRGQTCKLDAEDTDGDGILAGTCQRQELGDGANWACSSDDECWTGICSLGRCSQMCGQIDDCPPPLTCAQVPRILPDSAPRFGSCMEGDGVLSHEFTLAAPGRTVKIPVPSNAISFAMVAEVDDDEQLVGAWRVIAPSGRLLYAAPASPDDHYANPLRYAPARSISTLVVPSSPSIGIAIGVYEVDVRSQLERGGPGTAAPTVRVLYKLDSSATLDVHFHFLDLSVHPCASAFDGGQLHAAAAPDSPRFRAYLARVEEILAGAGIQLGAVTYRNIVDRGDIDAIDRHRAGDLFALADAGTGVNVFLVRSIAPAGVQAVVGATPGPPRTPGTVASGVAVAIETLCYRDWSDLARITVHAIARQMGLHYNRDPAGHPDTIADSDELSSNLMFFGDRGGVSLSDGQGDTLRRYPGLR